MKLKFLGLLMIFSGLPTVALAEFPFSSIRCQDANPTKKINVYLSSEGAGADQYEPREDAIAYEYGNTLYYGFDSGQLEVESKYNGVISLIDNYNAQQPVRLILVPQYVNAGQYDGTLTGVVEMEDGNWQEIKDYHLICTLTHEKL